MKPVDKSMRKYYIGFGVLGLFAVGIFIFVLTLASGNKQDSKTYNSANDIANKLDSYIDTNQEVPESLSAVGIKNAPNTIAYSKLSDSSYSFCVTYKGSGDNLNASAFDAFTGDLVTQELESSAGSASGGTQSELFIDPVHHKGQNCQTIKPYITAPASSSPCLAIDNVPCSTENQGDSGALNDDGSSAGTNNSTSDTDDEKANDVYSILGGLLDYTSDNGGQLPTSLSVSDGTVSFVPDDPQDPVSLSYYTKSSQIKAETYKAGDKNTTNNTTNDIMDIEFGAICSPTSVGDPVANSDPGSYAVLYSIQAGTACLDSNS